MTVCASKQVARCYSLPPLWLRLAGSLAKQVVARAWPGGEPASHQGHTRKRERPTDNQIARHSPKRCYHDYQYQYQHQPTTMTIKKCVRWSTITVYEFGVGIGGSAVPKRGGPSIGLARKPKHIWSSSLDDVCGAVTDDDDEDGELHENNASGDKIRKPRDAAQRKPKRLARRRKVRWLKPLERVTMLTKAGCSEKKIYRMMMESSEIAMSRRLSLCVDRGA